MIAFSGAAKARTGTGRRLARDIIAARRASGRAEAAEHQFAPHERPLFPGSPATPSHAWPRRIAYIAIGVLISLTSGFSNSVLTANLPQIQGALGLTSVEAGWLTAAYSMTSICMGFLLTKFRQEFGLQRFTRAFLIGFVVLAGVQCLVRSYSTELMMRAATGVVASGLTPLGFFYIMQGMSPATRLGGLVLGVGLSQVALPLARVISPPLLADGEIGNLYVLEFGLALLCLGAIALVRLPPSERAKVMEPLDALTFILFAPGMALLCAVLTQGRIVWWDTPWLGAALAGSVVLIGAALLIEHNRANPMLNTRWLATRDVVRFALVAATVRVLLSEQTFGSAGLLSVVGMGADQTVSLYAIVTGATLAGLVLSVVTLNPMDLERPVLISLALIAVAAFMDADATNLTRPASLFFTQALISFAAIYFLGPTMLTGIVLALARGPAHIVSYSAIFSISQTLGGLGGAALLGTFQTIRARHHLAELGSMISPDDPNVAGRLLQLSGAYGRVLGDPVLRQAEGVVLLNQQVTREANILAFNDVFFLIGCLALAAFIRLAIRWIRFRRRGVNPLGKELAALQETVRAHQEQA